MPDEKVSLPADQAFEISYKRTFGNGRVSRVTIETGNLTSTDGAVMEQLFGRSISGALFAFGHEAAKQADPGYEQALADAVALTKTKAV